MKFTEVKKIYNTAKIIATNIQTKLFIKSPLVFYEIIFYLSFLNDIRLIQNNKNEYFRQSVDNLLFKTLKYKRNIDYSIYEKLVKVMFLIRKKNYAELFVECNYKYSEEFFDNVIEYQTILIASIDKDDKFSHFNPLEIEGTDYEWGVEGGSVFKSPDRHKIISDILLDNFSIVLDFISMD